MVSRRRFAAMLGGVAGLAGCTETRTGSNTPTRTDSSTVSPADEVSPATDLPDWEPTWTVPVEGRPLGVNAAGSAGGSRPTDETPLYVTSETAGRTTITAVDPTTPGIVWETTLDGSAVTYSYATTQGIARGGWGVTITPEAVYAAVGRPDERGPTAIHALDPTTGARLWQFDNDRELGVAGVTDGLLVARAREYVAGTGTPPPTGVTEPRSSLLYGLDPANGTVRWQREVFDHRETVVTADGVFTAAAAGLRAFTPDGTRQTTLDCETATAVAVVGSRVVALVNGERTPTLYGLDATGNPEWRRSLPVEELLATETRLYGGGDVAAALEPDGSLAWRDGASARWLLLDPDRDTLYTRSGVAADGATAYAADGTRRWRFVPPSNNAWPEAATREAAVVSAITGEPFVTTYAVGPDGRARKSRGFDTLFDALGHDDTVYAAAETGFLALDP